MAFYLRNLLRFSGRFIIGKARSSYNSAWFSLNCGYRAAPKSQSEECLSSISPEREPLRGQAQCSHILTRALCVKEASHIGI